MTVIYFKGISLTPPSISAVQETAILFTFLLEPKHVLFLDLSSTMVKMTHLLRMRKKAPLKMNLMRQKLRLLSVTPPWQGFLMQPRCHQVNILFFFFLLGALILFSKMSSSSNCPLVFLPMSSKPFCNTSMRISTARRQVVQA